jgi:hypothetical protein
MPDRELSAVLLALALLSGGCGERRDHAVRGSVTVKLPPASTATPKPGFSFDSPQPSSPREL